MSDKEISDTKIPAEFKGGLIDREINMILDRINSTYASLTSNKADDNKSLSPPSSLINTVSPMAQLESISKRTDPNAQPDEQGKEENEKRIEPFEANDQLLFRKRKLKKINYSKKEMNIKVINCPNNYNILYNYSYLFSDFKGEFDQYALFNTPTKSELSESLFQSYKSKDFSFGESPCKLYYDYISGSNKIQADEINAAVMHLPLFSSENQFVIPAFYLPKNNNKNNKGKTSLSSKEKKPKKKAYDKKKQKAKEIEEEEEEDENDIDDDQSNDDEDNNNVNNKSKYDSAIEPKKSRKDKDKIYYCTLCTCIFTSPQGLGGHMSRTHKDQSIKFQNKKQIRQLREPQRKLLEKAKIILCERFNEDYSLLSKSKKGKEVVKNLVLTYKKEYKLIRKKLREQLI